uniref:Uncharacterized protein n=1 Tax=Trichobilharzia regenti TaxID=157069 RepID=A0AA85IX00_TRIRE|nr:unnamed protein product [Trichobilharzia regenti]CAH8861924.1 unnamed protein product [Trichobilharzia regenti]
MIGYLLLIAIAISVVDSTYIDQNRLLNGGEVHHSSDQVLPNNRLGGSQSTQIEKRSYFYYWRYFSCYVTSCPDSYKYKKSH